MRVPSSDRIVGSLVVFAAVVIAIGCGDPLGPAGVAGTYVLQTIDGDSLPVAPAPAGPSNDYTVVVIADTLRLTPDGRGSLVTIEDIVPDSSGSQPARARNESMLHFSVDDDDIRITLECPPNALMLCAAEVYMTARLSSHGLSASRSYGTLQQLLTYTQVEGE